MKIIIIFESGYQCQREGYNISEYSSILDKIFSIDSRSIGFDQLCNSIIQHTEKIDFLDFNTIHFIEDTENKNILYCSSSSKSVEERKSMESGCLDDITKKVLNTKSIFCYRDISQLENAINNHGERSLISIPVSTGHNVRWVIHFVSYPSDSFTREQMNFLMSLGTVITTVLLRSDLVENEKIDQDTIDENLEKCRILTDRDFELIIEVSSDGTFIYANDLHEKVLGYKPRNLAGSNIFKYIHAEDISTVIRAFSKGMGTFSTEYVKFRYRNIDGHWIWLESVGTPYRIMNGDTRAIVASRVLGPAVN